MSDPTSGAGSRAERLVLERLAGFLDTQDERLDEADVETVAEFLARNPEPLRGDWSRIRDALLAQVQQQPDVAPTLEALESRLAAPEEVARVLAGKLTGVSGRPTPAVVFLLGAGISRAEPTSIPTVTEFLPNLWRKAEEIGHKPLLRIRDQCRSIGVDNIEDLLTAIALAQAAMGNDLVLQLVSDLIGPSAPDQDEPEWRFRIDPRHRRARVGGRRSRQAVDSSLLDSLRDSTQTLFSVLVGMMVDRPANAAHSAVASFVSSRPQHRIVTTNYDTCIEAAVGEKGYSYGIGNTSPSSHEGDVVTPIFKLHGSLNWYSCLNCDRYVTASLPAIHAAHQQGLYPIMAMCSSCQATAQQLIVPPIAQKYHSHPMLLDVRKLAEDAFIGADVIVPVGYSFSEVDEYVLRMIARAALSDSGKCVAVFDRSVAPAKRLRKFLQTHVHGFESDGRVFHCPGDAANTLPAFLSALADSHAPKPHT